MVQLHKKFTCKQVGDLIVRYLAGEIEREYIQEILGIGKTRFFALVKNTEKIRKTSQLSTGGRKQPERYRRRLRIT